MIPDAQLIQQIQEASIKDTEFSHIIHTLQGILVERPPPASLLAHYSIQEDGTLMYDQTHICIPKGPLHTQILHDHHDTPMAGHQGIERTYAAAHKLFYWPQMNNDVQEYVKSCD